MQDLPLGALPTPEEPPRNWLDAWNEALSFWEPRRLLFNLVLLLVTLWVLASASHGARVLSLKVGCELIVCAGAANLCYCAAYPADFLLSAISRAPGLWRNLLFLAGTVLGILFSQAALAVILWT